MAEKKVDILELEVRVTGLEAYVGGLKKAGKGSDDTKKKIGGLKGALQSIQKNWLAIGAAAAGVFVVLNKGIQIVKDLNQAANEEQVIFAQQAAVLKSTGNVAGVTTKQLYDLSNGLSNVSTFSDDAVRRAQNIGLTFTNISKDAFPGFMQAVVDLTASQKGAAATEEDLIANAKSLGRAFNDPRKTLTLLNRQGISFNDTLTKQIFALQDAGKYTEAQAIIQKELETRYGGSAKAIAETTAGMQKQAANLKQDIQAALGEIIQTLTGGVNKSIVPTMQKILAWIERNRDTIIRVARVVMSVGKLVFRTAISQFRAAYDNITNGIETGTKLFDAFKRGIKQSFDDIIGVGKSFGSIFKNLLSGNFKGALNATDEYINGIGKTFSDGFSAGGEIANIIATSSQESSIIFKKNFIKPIQDFGDELGNIIGGSVEKPYYYAGEVAAGSPPGGGGAGGGAGGTGFIGGFTSKIISKLPEISKSLGESMQQGLIQGTQDFKPVSILDNLDMSDVDAYYTKIAKMSELISNGFWSAVEGAKSLLNYVKQLALEAAKKGLLILLKGLLGQGGFAAQGISGFGDFVRSALGFAGGGIIGPNFATQFSGGVNDALNAIRVVNSPTPVNAGGKLGIAGEAGREAIIPEQYWGQLGNKNYNINISSSGYMSREDEKRLANTVQDAIKRIDRNNL